MRRTFDHLPQKRVHSRCVGFRVKLRMQKTVEESRREWRSAFWVIVIAMFGALVASVVGLILFHGLPGGR